jgi:hypothetical protein
MNHAICDVFNLVDTLKSLKPDLSNLKAAVHDYSLEVVRRGSDEVKSSRKQATMLLDWDQLMDSPMMKQGLNRNTLDDDKAAVVK